MQRKLWLALAAAGLVAAPFAAQAASHDDGKIVVAQGAGGGAPGGGAPGGGAAGGGGGAGGGAAGGAAGGSSGGSDTNNSVMAPGSNPPGDVSPGAPSSAATGSDVQSGAYSRTNPGTDDPARLHGRKRGSSGYGSTTGSTTR